MRVFHTSVSWLSLTGVWVTTSLLMSPELFSVFKLILMMPLSEWSPVVHLFPSLPVPLSIFSGIFLCAQITISITVMFHSFFLSQTLDIYLPFRFLLILFCGQPGRQSPLFNWFFFYIQFFFFDYHSVLSSSRDLGICFYIKIQGKSHSPGRIPGSAYTIFSYGQIFCTIPSG